MGSFTIGFLGILIVAFFILRSRVRTETVKEHIDIVNPVGSAMTIGDRELQQDHLCSALGYEGALLVLADGKGRSHGGKIAAKIACDTFLDLYSEYQSADKPQYYFRRAFNAANRKILNTLDERQGYVSAAVAMVRKNFLYYAVVGNTKISVFRRGELIPISEGQTIDVLAQQRYREGKISKQIAVQLLDEQRQYNFLGQDEFHDIEFFSKPIELRSGDIVVLMTEGVTSTLSWVEIENALRRGGTPNKMALNITEAVNKSEMADKENASVLLYQN